jgi:hypothetical protein
MLRFIYKNKNKEKKIVQQPEQIQEIINDDKPIKKSKLKNDSKIKMNITKQPKENYDSE